MILLDNYWLSLPFKFYGPDCFVKALLFSLFTARGHPRTSLQGSLRIRAPFYKAGHLAVCSDASLRHHKDSVSKSIVLPCISQPSRGLHSYWQVISYFQVSSNHSNLAFFLISTSEWGRCTEIALFFPLCLELLCSRWAALLVQRDSMKEHLPIFLMVTNYTDGNVQPFFLCFEKKPLPCRKAIVTFIPGSWDTVEW